MKHKISDDKTTLTFTVDRAEQALLRKLTRETGIESDQSMYEWFEGITGNSELQWIPEGSTGDLTSAPMLGILGEERPFSREDSTIPHIITGPNTIQPIESRWAYMDYQVRSVLEDLRDNGEAVFVGGEL